jgi:hypothetical protein
MAKILDLKEKAKFNGFIVKKRNKTNSAWGKNPRYDHLMPPLTTKFCRNIEQVEDLVRSGFFGNGEILLHEVYRGKSGRMYIQKAIKLCIVDYFCFKFPTRS